MIEGGQQVPTRAARDAGSAQCLAVHGDRPAGARRRGSALLGPAARCLIQGISIHGLQSPPERGLTRHYPGDTERIPGGLVRISGPLGDRRERPGAGQHRAQRQAQDHRQPVPHTPALAGIRHRGQHRQQPAALYVQAPGGSDQLANSRVNQG
jgi:hypothetical protein